MAGKKYTDEQKDEFFRLLDRGGTVRAAARALGVNENAGYNWLRKTGLTMKRAAPRIYPPELKTEFLRLVSERQIISSVAVELGIQRSRHLHRRRRRLLRGRDETGVNCSSGRLAGDAGTGTRERGDPNAPGVGHVGRPGDSIQ
jgi:transposase-like protein